MIYAETAHGSESVPVLGRKATEETGLLRDKCYLPSAKHALVDVLRPTVDILSRIVPIIPIAWSDQPQMEQRFSLSKTRDSTWGYEGRSA